MSRFIKVAAGLAIATIMGSTVQAGTSGHYTCATPPPPPSCTNCDTPKTGSSTLPPLSSYFEHQARCVVKEKVVHVPPPVIHPPKDDCRIVVHRPKRHCYVVGQPPIVRPPVVHPPVVRPPVVRPPVFRPPVVIRPPVVVRPPVTHTTHYRVVRPVVPVPYPVPVQVYTGCGYNPCPPPVRRYSRYGY